MNDGVIIAVIVALVGSPALSALVSALVGRHFQKKDKELVELQIIIKAVKALSHDAYMRHCRYLLKKDELTEDEMENHMYLWNTYNALGMNGKGEKMHEQVKAMKVIPDDPEWYTKKE